MSLSTKDLETLRKPFDEKTIAVKVQSLSKDKTKAGLVCYLQHTDVYDRLESVDPSWSAEVTGTHFTGDTVTVRVKLTILGVSRENAGDGSDLKGATSDAIKRAAMLFGVGRYLYDTEIAWVSYNEQTDKFKSFTIEDHRRALRSGQAATPVGSASAAPAAATPPPVSPIKPAAVQAPVVVNKRGSLGVQIMTLARAMSLKDEDLSKISFENFKQSALKDLTIPQMERLLELLQYEHGRNFGGPFEQRS